MTVQEEIIAKVQNLPENALPEVYEFVENIVKKESKPSFMQRLRQIKIEGPPDFAENFDLYASREKSLDEYLEKDTIK